MYLSYRWLFFYPRHTGHYAIFHFSSRMHTRDCYLRHRNLYMIPLNRRPNIPYIRPLNTQSKQCNCCQKQKETTWGLKITVIAFHDLLCVYSLASGASGRKAKIHHGKVIIVLRGSVSRFVAHVCWLDIFMVSCYVGLTGMAKEIRLQFELELRPVIVMRSSVALSKILSIEKSCRLMPNDAGSCKKMRKVTKRC